MEVPGARCQVPGEGSSSSQPGTWHLAPGTGGEAATVTLIEANLDVLNPQVASRLARSMDRWRRYAPALQTQMKSALQKVSGVTKLSNDVNEVVSKALTN